MKPIRISDKKHQSFSKVILCLLFILTTLSYTKKIKAATWTVTIQESDAVSDIEANFDQAMLDAEVGDSIIINGGKSNGDAVLRLITTKKVTVVWQATYSSSERVVFDGVAAFEIVSGSITCSTGDVALQTKATTTTTVKGGSIKSNDASSVTVACFDSSKLIVTSGLIENTAGLVAIEGRAGTDITISGGNVKSNSKADGGTISTYSKLEIKGGTVENTSTDNGTAVYGLGTSTLTISGGTVKNNCTNAAVIFAAGNLNIKGGTLASVKGAKIATVIFGYNSSNKICTISGGTITGVDVAFNLIGEKNTLKISKGTLKSAGKTIIQGGKNNIIEITDGSFETSGKNGTVIDTGTLATIKINGGNFKGNNIILVNELTKDNTTTINISGGTFSATKQLILDNGKDTKITVTGGILSTTHSSAIECKSGSSVIISHGFIFARAKNLEGSGTDTVIRSSGDKVRIEGSAVVVGWNPVRTKYQSDSKDDLVSNSTASVFWMLKDKKSGIGYENAKNKGFFVVAGVSVGDFKRTISFETNGGTITKPVTVLEGDKVSPPNTPFKDGYEFEAWCTTEDLNVVYNFDSLVKGDFTLYAKWKEVEKPNNNDIDDDNTEVPPEKTNSSWIKWAILGGSVLVLIVGLTVVILLIAKRKRRRPRRY